VSATAVDFGLVHLIASDACFTGCGRAATLTVTAEYRDRIVSTRACGRHRGDAEVANLRQLADAVELAIVELRRSRWPRAVPNGSSHV
jgi:hypothetical protein